MSRYLRDKDYLKTIQTENLSQIVNKDFSILYDSEKAAIEKAKTYLTQKFNVEEEFTSTVVYSLSKTYQAGITAELNGNQFIISNNYSANDIVLNNGLIYYTSASTSGIYVTGGSWILLGNQYDLYHTKIPQDYFNFTRYYYIGEKVYWNGKVYTCIAAGSGYYPDINTPISNGTKYWGNGINYYVPAGTPLEDTNYWEFGDFRSQEMVYTIIDMVLYLLHKRIAPANIPDLRVKAYDDAIQWLIDCYEGNITPNLLVKTPRSGGRFRIGSNPKKNNAY